MKKILVLFFILILVTGCGSSSESSNNSNKDSNVNNTNNSREKVIVVLEQNDFKCSGDICEKEYASNGWEYTHTINFSTYQYTFKTENTEYVNGIKQTNVLTDNYNWKTNYSKSEIYITGYYEALITGILDNNNEFSCSGGNEDSCYSRKTRILELKREFSDWLAQADVEVEDLT